MNIKIFTYKNFEIRAQAEFFIPIRLRCFSEYPYLYDGTMEEREEYLANYTNNEKSILVIAYIDEKPIGFLAGVSLVSSTKIIAKAPDLFNSRNLNPYDYFYYAEMCVDKKYPNLYVVYALANKMNSVAKSMGFKYSCCLTIIREEGNPMKPTNYRDISQIGIRMGYKKLNLQILCSWDTITLDGTKQNQPHMLDFWSKDIQ